MTARLTVEQRRLRDISEQSWQNTVTEHATRLGWKWYHAPENRPVTSRKGTVYVQNIRAGWPDLAMVRGGRMVFAELKKEVGVVSPEQVKWLYALGATGARVYVWRPRDLAEVLAVLDGKDVASMWQAA